MIVMVCLGDSKIVISVGCGGADDKPQEDADPVESWSVFWFGVEAAYDEIDEGGHGQSVAVVFQAFICQKQVREYLFARVHLLEPLRGQLESFIIENDFVHDEPEAKYILFL